MLYMPWICLVKLESCSCTARNRVKASLMPASSVWWCPYSASSVLLKILWLQDSCTERGTGISVSKTCVIKSCINCFLKTLTSVVSVKPHWLQLFWNFAVAFVCCFHFNLPSFSLPISSLKGLQKVSVMPQKHFSVVFAEITAVMELCSSISICLIPGASLKSLQGLTDSPPSGPDVLCDCLIT